MVFKEINSLFVHIPKCAGSTVSSRLGEHFYQKEWDKQREKLCTINGRWAQHWTYQEYLKVMSSKEIDSMYKFCFVRNPWDRVVSEFVYVKSRGCQCKNKEQDSLSFDRFVKQKFPCSYGRHKIPQVDFIIDENGKNRMDSVFRFEHFEKDFSSIVDRFSLKKSKHLTKNFNTTRGILGRLKKPYWEYYSPRTRLMVESIYIKDIEYFNYEFGE